MDNHLVKWNTGRLINAQLDNLIFFRGYKAINIELFEVYTELSEYASEHYRNIGRHNHNHHGYDEDTHTAWVEYLDKMLSFQLFVTSKEDNAEVGEIAKRAKVLFGNKDVAEAYCADLHILEQLNMLVEYSDSVRNLFNFILPLYNDNEVLKIETEFEIRSILEAKGLGTFEVPEHLIINKQIQNSEEL